MAAHMESMDIHISIHAYACIYPPAPFRGPPGCEGYVSNSLPVLQVCSCQLLLVDIPIRVLPSPDRLTSTWVPPGYPLKIIRFQAYSQDPHKSEKVSPRSPNIYQEDIPKSIESHPVRQIAKKKTQTSYLVYNVFNTSDNGSWWHFLTPNPIKKTPQF
jgi:hypothetical protein